MLVLFSGEGAADVGCADDAQEGVCRPGQWRPGPMAWLASQIFEAELGYSLLDSSAYFVSETVLGRLARSMKNPRLRGVRRNLYHRKGALALAALTLAMGDRLKQPVAAVLFRDCDGSQSAPGTRWEDLHASISGDSGGFCGMGLRTGVAMLPKPKSEAWLLCALRTPRYQHCERLEEESGNDRGLNPLKTQLDECLKNYDVENIADLLKPDTEGRIVVDARRIDMPSFRAFEAEFRQALRRSEKNWRETETEYASLWKQCLPLARSCLGNIA